MKFFSGFLSAIGLLHVAAASMAGLDVREDQPDSQTMAAYEKSGNCMYYYTNRQPNWRKGAEPCIKYCQNNGGHGYAECDMNSFKDIDVEKATGFPKYTDDDGFPWVPAPCKCENKAVEALATELIEIVAKALAQLDNILCAIFVSAIKEVAEIGLMFVPGGAAVKGADKVIQYAKSAYENGMNAADFYTDWVGKACGVPNWHFGLEDMFIDLVNAPDSMMGGVIPTGCLLKDKKRCKNLDKKSDPKDGQEIHKGMNPDQKKDDEEKKKKEEEENNKSCKIKRAHYVPPPKRKINKFDEEEKRMTKECLGGKDQDVVHITRTHNDIGYYIQERKDIPKIICKKEHIQACYHYRHVFEDFSLPLNYMQAPADTWGQINRSVMSRYSNTKDMTEWTCQQTATRHGKDWGYKGKATASWGVTALAAMPGSNVKTRGQHWFPWANGFIYRERVMVNGQQKLGADKKPVWKGCERDEFPPKLIRLIPQDQNGAAGQLWNGFCNDNNAESTTNPVAKPEETYVVSAHLKSVKGKEEKHVQKGTTSKAVPLVLPKRAFASHRANRDGGGETASITTVTVSTLRAIVSISEFEGLKPEPYDGLEENPCFPRDLIDDPGWALLTDDEWYKSEGRQHAAKTAEYRKSPTKAQVDAAKVKMAADANRKGKLEALDGLSLADLMKKFKQKKEADMWNKLVGNGDGQIPIELWGVLPSLPPFPKPAGVTRKKRHGGSLDDIDGAAPYNETLVLQDRDTNADLDGDDHEVDLDSLTDEELEQWLAQYEEVARRMYAFAEEEEEELTPTSPPVVEAQATMAAVKGDEGLVRGEPAAVGSEVTDGLPLPTGM
ncbi:uncharacterized protein PG986_015170 [Apiospora aurea]|uniref:Uncharacterized protein n=1 Tax=Apiospora aurea TaxID=335848 RepID=A0ABR1PRU2_9PEZI